MKNQHLLAIDQGTTNSRAIVFNATGTLISQHEIGLKQSFPHDGWVEQDPIEMFNNTVICCHEALKTAGLSANDIAAVGISNQRETTIIWDKNTGNPIYPAISWQDSRTSELCNKLQQHPINQHIQEKTGLFLYPYFSATKIIWILDTIPHARERAERGELLFGTVDTFLLWKFSNGKSHATDATNASRTLLFNIHTQEWDQDILNAFNIPANLLPTVLDSSAHFGDIDKKIFGHTLPITGIAGDQQAAAIGQACFQSGMVKTTYGTGCFMLLNTGSTVVHSQNHLLSTVLYRINNQVNYALEGSIFCAGTTIKWLRDKLKLISSSAETENLAASIPNTHGVYLVPAFTGLGAPYWDSTARGALLGLTANTSINDIVRAALESVAYQTCDLLTAMTTDSQCVLKKMRVDGGMVANKWLLQFLSDMLNLEVQHPACIETTALGVAYLAGLQIGMYHSLDEIAQLWQSSASYTPTFSAAERNDFYTGWKCSIKRVIKQFP